MRKALLLILASGALLCGCASAPEKTMGAGPAMPLWEGPWGDHH